MKKDLNKKRKKTKKIREGIRGLSVLGLARKYGFKIREIEDIIRNPEIHLVIY